MSGGVDMHLGDGMAPSDESFIPSASSPHRKRNRRLFLKSVIFFFVQDGRENAPRSSCTSQRAQTTMADTALINDFAVSFALSPFTGSTDGFSSKKPCLGDKLESSHLALRSLVTGEDSILRKPKCFQV